MTDDILDVRDLSVTFETERGPVEAVQRVTFRLAPGRTLGLVGESGSGKSVTTLAVMGLLARNAKVSGSIAFAGQDLAGLRRSQLQRIRGRDIGIVFQDPMTSLNPTMRIGPQIGERLERHAGLGSKAARRRAIELLDEVGIASPGQRVDEYPHQLSGGMRQRVMIAMALATSPRLIIADEPTTALDVTVQAQILTLLRDLVEQRGAALLMITHDLGVVAGLCDEVQVMYHGRIVEGSDTWSLFQTPRHPYTRALLAAVPRIDADSDAPLQPIDGSPLKALPWREACAFAPRCRRRQDDCLAPAEAFTAARPPEGLRCIHPHTASRAEEVVQA